MIIRVVDVNPAGDLPLPLKKELAQAGVITELLYALGCLHFLTLVFYQTKVQAVDSTFFFFLFFGLSSDWSF